MRQREGPLAGATSPTKLNPCRSYSLRLRKLVASV